MTTNGSRKIATISYAPNVGPQTPISGAQTLPQPVPAPTLTSANARTPSIKETPTMGPVSASISHQARDDISSRHSLLRSQRNALLGEGKEHLFQIACWLSESACGRGVCQFVERASPADLAAAQQHEAIAHAGGIGDLMDGQKQRAPF